MGLINKLFGLIKTTNSSEKQIIHDTYYSNYPVKPYISDERNVEEWMERTKLFPKQNIIPKIIMTPYSDGLLPGHIYMLYWLKKYKNKRVPAYFEYRYGIDFEKEKEFLFCNKYLDANGKPTQLGLEAINKHIEVIEAQHPQPKFSETSVASSPDIKYSGRKIPENLVDGFFPIPHEDQEIISYEIDQINKLVSYALKLSHIKRRFRIDASRFVYLKSHTYYEGNPFTPSGRPKKIPLILHYDYKNDDQILESDIDRDFFGEIGYLQNGHIAKARLIFWFKKEGYIIHLGIVDNILTVKKVEKSGDPTWIPIYKLK